MGGASEVVRNKQETINTQRVVKKANARACMYVQGKNKCREVVEYKRHVTC